MYFTVITIPYFLVIIFLTLNNTLLAILFSGIEIIWLYYLFTTKSLRFVYNPITFIFFSYKLGLKPQIVLIIIASGGLLFFLTIYFLGLLNYFFLMYLIIFWIIFFIISTQEKIKTKKLINSCVYLKLTPSLGELQDVHVFFNSLTNFNFLSLEIYANSKTCSFLVLVPEKDQFILENLLTSSYPHLTITKIPLITFYPTTVIDLNIEEYSFLPLKEIDKDSYQLRVVLEQLTSLKDEEEIIIQYLFTADKSWTEKLRSDLLKMLTKQNNKYDNKINFKSRFLTDSLLKTKLTARLLTTTIRIGIKSGNDIRFVKALNAAYSSFDSNGSLVTRNNSKHRFNYPYFSPVELINLRVRPNYLDCSFFSALELTSLYSLPISQLNLPNLNISKFKPTATNSELLNLTLNKSISLGTNTSAEKVYLTPEQRLKHLYVVGKTGTGKTTLLENLLQQDFELGNGLCLIDPHGDLSANILDYVPQDRLGDVIYLDPTESNVIGFNPLSLINPQNLDYKVDAMISTFKRIWGNNAIGPQSEDYLRYSLLALGMVGGYTLLELNQLLIDYNFREHIISKLTDPIVKSYWENYEFNRRTDELTRPLLNKLGKLRGDSRIRKFLGQTESRLDFSNVINNNKILIINLATGKLGNELQSLLGSLILIELEMAALGRVNMDITKRQEFYLYIDEFQRFATTSVLNLLAEARKYRFGLILANQYLEQFDETIASGILSNVNTIVALRVGSLTARKLYPEFSSLLKDYTDLLVQPNWQAYVKTTSIKPVDIFSLNINKELGKKLNSKKTIIEKMLKLGTNMELVEKEINNRQIVNQYLSALKIK